ncbi:DUF4304 domain-containing protein [Chryseobacterium sp.]|uniref:DUF4304 domain-containing protein n=1 Tax=Chryseobacterium sp. TaxID=1871047 RepID=UPI00333E820F
MESKKFKTVFGEIAKENGFLKTNGGWYKETSECLSILELQKSKFGNYFQLNIKIFIQGVFDRTYKPDKDLIQQSLGHVNGSETENYKEVLNFDNTIEDEVRILKLNELFKNHIVPFTTKTSTRLGIQELESTGKVFILPLVKVELEKLMR